MSALLFGFPNAVGDAYHLYDEGNAAAMLSCFFVSLLLFPGHMFDRHSPNESPGERLLGGQLATIA